MNDFLTLFINTFRRPLVYEIYLLQLMYEYVSYNKLL